MDNIKAFKEKVINNYISNIDYNVIDVEQIKADLQQLLGENVLTYRQSLPTISAVTLANVREHHRRTHTTNNMRFVIAGKLKGTSKEYAGTYLGVSVVLLFMAFFLWEKVLSFQLQETAMSHLL